MAKTYTMDFDPKKVKVLPKIDGKTETLSDGTVRVHFTEAEFWDVKKLISGILDDESNLYTEEHNELVEQYEYVV